jgi:CubicO group peptidase (beta-lactamase class C family)
MNPDDFKRGAFGYGLLWWIWDGPAAEGAYKGAYSGMGAVGQFLTVLPALDLVVAHKTRPGRREVPRPEFLALLQTIVDARCETEAHAPERRQ